MLKRFISQDPIGLQAGVNYYGYVLGNPVSYTDPDGQIPLLVIIPVVGGAINAIANAVGTAGQCGSDWMDILGAAGRGFVSGAAGSAVGLGIGIATGNPYLAGAAGGLAGDIVDQFASKGRVDFGSALVATGSGLVGGGVANKLFPLRGFQPHVTKSRNVNNFGRNSQRMVGQEAVSGAIGGTAGAGYSSLSRGIGCECE